MSRFDFDEWAASLTIRGEQAYLPGKAPKRRPSHNDPEYMRAYRAAHREIILVRNREWMRRWRAERRYAHRFLPCPGSRCLTMVRGGGLCSFCRK